MSIDVRPLVPDDAERFADYFSGLDFSHSPYWSTCYCRFYFLDDSTQDWMTRTGALNREESVQAIRSGEMKGYLAFDGPECVGWCNANDLGRLRRLAEYAENHAAGLRLGCTICFVIHPAYRGQGIARRMLRQAVEDFRRDGFDGMLAVPVEAPNSPQKRYRGTRRMYEELGYEEVASEGPLSVMRLLFR